MQVQKGGLQFTGNWRRMLSSTPCWYSLQIHIANPCWNQDAVRWRDVKVCTVPYLKRIGNTRDTPICQKAFCNWWVYSQLWYNKHPNRDWIWNIINTSWQVEFQHFIRQKISERNQRTLKFCQNLLTFSNHQRIYDFLHNKWSLINRKIHLKMHWLCT